MKAIEHIISVLIGPYGYSLCPMDGHCDRVSLIFVCCWTSPCFSGVCCHRGEERVKRGREIVNERRESSLSACPFSLFVVYLLSSVLIKRRWRRTKQRLMGLISQDWQTHPNVYKRLFWSQFSKNVWQRAVYSFDPLDPRQNQSHFKPVVQ